MLQQVSVLDTILERGHRYKGPKQLYPSLSGDKIRSEQGLITSALAGLRFLISNFDLIKDDGGLVGDKRVFVPKYEKKFLKELKESFKSPKELESRVKEFLNKK